jgi:hypothetical protein
MANMIRVTSELKLWHAATGAALRTVEGCLGDTSAIAFAPDGKMVLTADQEEAVLTETLTGLRRLTLGASQVARLDLDARQLWQELAQGDGSQAYRAMMTLVARPREAVTLLEKELKPVPETTPDRIARLVADLDSDQFATREQAARELQRLGDLAEGTVRGALQGQPSAEVRRQAQALLEKLDIARSPLRLRDLRAIEVLEAIGTAEARRVLHALTQGEQKVRLTQEAAAALDRMARRPAVSP